MALKRIPDWVGENSWLPELVAPERFGGPVLYEGDPDDPEWLSAITCSDGVAYVHTFGVAPRNRGNGVMFRRAVDMTIQRAKEMGATAIQINVAPDDVRVLGYFGDGSAAVRANALLTLDLRGVPCR